MRLKEEPRCLCESETRCVTSFERQFKSQGVAKGSLFQANWDIERRNSKGDFLSVDRVLQSGNMPGDGGKSFLGHGLRSGVWFRFSGRGGGIEPRARHPLGSGGTD